MSKVAPPLSSCNTFLLELQAVSPDHGVVVHLKWHFIDFVDAMHTFVDFDHVSSYMLGSFNTFKLSQYSWHFRSEISFVALRCTCSSDLWALMNVDMAGYPFCVGY